jgi:hypothetical protein
MRAFRSAVRSSCGKYRGIAPPGSWDQSLALVGSVPSSAWYRSPQSFQQAIEIKVQSGSYPHLQLLSTTYLQRLIMALDASAGHMRFADSAARSAMQMPAVIRLLAFSPLSGCPFAALLRRLAAFLRLFCGVPAAFSPLRVAVGFPLGSVGALAGFFSGSIGVPLGFALAQRPRRLLGYRAVRFSTTPVHCYARSRPDEIEIYGYKSRAFPAPSVA